MRFFRMRFDSRPTPEPTQIEVETIDGRRTPVKLIIQTPAAGTIPARVHTRADLVGSIAGFDGNAYSVDFVRLPVEEPEPPPRGRRRR